MDAGIQSHGYGCGRPFKLQNHVESYHPIRLRSGQAMALDSGFPRQSLTGAGSAGTTTFLVLAEASLFLCVTSSLKQALNALYF